MQYGPIVPTLKISSMKTSLAFYTKLLDFQQKWGWSTATNSATEEIPDFACIECGEAVIFLSRHGEESQSSLFIELPFVEQIDELFHRIENARDDFVGKAVPDDLSPLQIDQTPADMPWGSREFILRDPDGHRLKFSCPISRKRNE